MKTTKFLKLIVPALVVAVTIFSCVQDDDYDTPKLNLSDPEMVGNIDISLVKQMDNGGLVNFADAVNDNTTGSLVIEGYVISNDEAGNFYKTLVIQDAPESPQAGIQIDIDDPALYDLYKPGQKVYVTLYGRDDNGNLLPPLGMENMNGVLHIGAIVQDAVERISATEYTKYIKRSSEVATLVPTVITPGEYSDGLINTLVQINDMQLRSEELGSAYANPDDTYTVNRYLKNCGDDSETIIRNSGYSSFKSQLFPEGRGAIVSVFSKYNNDYQLFIRDTEDVMFTDNRCDPLFEETFNSAINNTTLNLPGWVNFTEAGSDLWTEQVYQGNGYAQFDCYGSGDELSVGWLITPGIELPAGSSPVFSFLTEHAYYDAGHMPLEVFISTDFDGTSGDVLTATWDEVTGYNTSYEEDFDTWFSWTPSGDIDLTAYAGQTIYIAFKYTGSDANEMQTRLHIENVNVEVP